MMWNCHNIGWFSRADQETPEYDPRAHADCPICTLPVFAGELASGSPPQDGSRREIKTISFLLALDSRPGLDGITRSYFYRVHTSCYDKLSDVGRTRLDETLIAAALDLFGHRSD